MKKAYKGLCILMSVIIIVSSFLMVFSVNNMRLVTAFDIFSCNQIADDIKNYEMNMTSVIYVKNENDSWEEYQRIHGDENRIWVDLEKIPQSLIDAFVSIEDQRFYEHGGVDWKRSLSAFANLIFHFWDTEQGGSTITQQLIKNITSDNDKTAVRKVREIIRALAVEKILDKDTILEAYLNTISLGNGICGVQVASNYYFNKDVSQLSLAECASLAGITKNPSAYNPVSDPEANLIRRRAVLKKMLELKKISMDQYNDAYEVELKIDTSQKITYETEINSYFVDALIDDVITDLAAFYGCTEEQASKKLYTGGYKIYSTLNTGIQSEIDAVYSDKKKYFSQVSSSDKNKSLQSAMTVMDYEGHIVGICGGVGEKTVNRGLNRATDSPRQPGSTMKPLGAYAPAIDSGLITYSSVLEDKPIKNYFGQGKDGPKEWYGYYAGDMPVKTAIERSANTIPCWIVKDLGIDKSYEFLTQKLHLTYLNENDKNLASLAIGGCNYGITTTQSAAAYAVFGNGGLYFEPTTYYKITDTSGNIVLESSAEGEQVIKPATASVMNMLLQNVVYGSRGTGGRIAGYSSMKAYAKTGTSSESNDLWMVAGTPYYVASVWCGFDTPEPVKNASAAANVWRAIMSKVHKGLEKKSFEMSDDLDKKTYCTVTGLLASKNCKSTAVGFYIPDVEVKYCSGKHPSPGSESSADSSSSSSETSSAASSQTSSTESVSSSESHGSSSHTSQ